MRRELEERLALLLDELNPLDRAVVTLKYWYEMPLEEIAANLGLTTSAVKSRLHRSRRELAERCLRSNGLERRRGELTDVPLPV
jgi:RNA polymerase sigma-70 factor (ECF subfamily)